MLRNHPNCDPRISTHGLLNEVLSLNAQESGGYASDYAFRFRPQ